MFLRQLFESLLYLVLLVGGLVFVQTSWQDYIAGKTDVSVSKEPLSLKDLPTLTMCLVFDKTEWLIYGQNYTIDVSISETKNQTITLEENKWVKALFSLEFHFMELFPRQLVKKSGGYWSKDWLQQCFT